MWMLVLRASYFQFPMCCDYTCSRRFCLRAKAMVLCRWILLLLKQGPRLIWAMLRRLFYRWGFKGAYSLFLLTNDQEKNIGGSHCRSSLPSGKAPREYHDVNDDIKAYLDTPSAKEGSPVVPDLSSTIPDNSETISLDNFGPSAPPLPGGSTGNASESSVNIESSEKAHEQQAADTSRRPPGLSCTPSRRSVNANSSRGSAENHFIVGIEDADGITSQAHFGADLADSRFSATNDSVSGFGLISAAHLTRYPFSNATLQQQTEDVCDVGLWARSY